MYTSMHRIGDIGIKLVTNVDLRPSFYFPVHDDYQATLIFFEGKEASPLFDQPHNELIVSSSRASGHELRQLMCYLGDFNSETYSAIHGCGIVVDGQGVLVIGGHGSGKTAVRNMFPDSQTLDDDLLMVDGEKMYVSGNIGSITIEGDTRGKSLHYLDGPDALREARIDGVLLLDKSHPGGYSSKENHTIPRSYSVLDALHPELQARYLELGDISVDADADVYVIGTDGSPELTLIEIQKILSRRIPEN